MLPTSAYKIRVRTDSADCNALMLLDQGELIAIILELADEVHGDDRGKWIIEATFGVATGRPAGLFPTAADAADWVSRHISRQPFDLGPPLRELC